MTKWISWTDSPPQIPWAPVDILVTDIGFYWRPLGVYREEFWRVTGRWV